MIGEKKDGSLLNIQLAANLVTDEQGLPIRMVATFGPLILIPLRLRDLL